ncbi:MAG: hypothetical protein DHS20C18_45130 [Saprospiraceae bacterium]|nr:MAG: hypothetical protein DHS20C18_45130 [Saprospiraceae bacterium]
MERLLKYFFSLLFITLFSCNQAPQLDYSQLSPVERQQMTIRVDSMLEFYTQGSTIRQNMLDTLIALNPNVESYYRQKSIAHSHIGDFHLAFPLMEKAAALQPESALFYYCWLLTYEYRDYNRALVRLEQYDQLTPDQTDVVWGRNIHFLKGLVRKQLGHQQMAVQEFTTCIAEDGKNVYTYAYVYRGICYAELKAYDKALADFDTAIEDYAKCTMAYYYKAMTLLKMHRQEEAIILLHQAEELLKQGYKETNSNSEVFDEVHLEMVEDWLVKLENG